MLWSGIFSLKKTQTIFAGFDEYNVYNVYNVDIVLNYQALWLVLSCLKIIVLSSKTMHKIVTIKWSNIHYDYTKFIKRNGAVL